VDGVSIDEAAKRTIAAAGQYRPYGELEAVEIAAIKGTARAMKKQRGTGRWPRITPKIAFEEFVARVEKRQAVSERTGVDSGSRGR